MVFIEVKHHISSYYIVVVFIDPLQGLFAILVCNIKDWFISNFLLLDNFKKGFPSQSLCVVVNQLYTS